MNGSDAPRIGRSLSEPVGISGEVGALGTQLRWGGARQAAKGRFLRLLNLPRVTAAPHPSALRLSQPRRWRGTLPALPSAALRRSGRPRGSGPPRPVPVLRAHPVTQAPGRAGPGVPSGLPCGVRRRGAGICRDSHGRGRARGRAGDVRPSLSWGRRHRPRRVRGPLPDCPDDSVCGEPDEVLSVTSESPAQPLPGDLRPLLCTTVTQRVLKSGEARDVPGSPRSRLAGGFEETASGSGLTAWAGRSAPGGPRAGPRQAATLRQHT